MGHCGGGDVRIIYLRDQRSIGSVGVRRTDTAGIFSPLGRVVTALVFIVAHGLGTLQVGKLQRLAEWVVTK